MKKSFMTRMLAVSLSAAMTFSLSSASSLTAAEAAAKKLPANNKAVSISLKVGNSKVLKLKNYKAWNIKKGATNKKAVAAVANKGTAAKRTIKVTAKKQGTAKVTLTLGKRKTADSKTTKYSKTIKKVVTVKVKAADTSTDTTTPADTTPTDTTPTTPSTTTGSATNVTPGVLHISQAAATHADVIAVSFSSIVTSTSAVKVTVTRGTSPLEIKEQKWDAGATGLSLTMTSKLSKGTYTVTATDGVETTTATVEVTANQDVDKIVFKGEQALTGRGTIKGQTDVSGAKAYVYFDVLDQYGDSMRETVSIQWTASAKVETVERSKGRITIIKNNEETFTYGDKIYVTGVYTKTGKSESGTFSVGTEQSVDKIQWKGFVKKGESKILEKLPDNFKANEYQFLYEAYDQNGNPMEAYDYLYENDDENRTKQLTFICDKVLVVKELNHNKGKTVTIGTEDYCAANIVPGIDVNSGGDLTITAIATKTGTRSDFSVVVGAYKILSKFTLGLPNDIVADGESVEIPFEAEDEEGNAIKNFKELASQSNFRKLTFNESDGYLVLSEKDDGTAKLVWSDYKIDNEGQKPTSDAQWGSSSANGIDRPISLTSIVVGGNTSNQLLQVSDKARPEAISDVEIDPAMVDRHVQKISYGNITFIDQYGRNMKATYEKNRKDDLWMYEYEMAGFEKDWNGKYVYDNGFFAASDAGLIGGSDDFSKYKYGVQVSKSSDFNTYAYDASDGELDNLNSSKVKNRLDLSKTDSTNNILFGPGNPRTYNEGSASEIVKEKKDEPGFLFEVKESGTTPELTLKFAIVRRHTTDYPNTQDQETSKKLTKSFKVVPIKSLTNFTIDDLNKFRLQTAASDYDNGKDFINKYYNATHAGNDTDIAGSSYVFDDSLDYYVSGSKYKDNDGTVLGEYVDEAYAKKYGFNSSYIPGNFDLKLGDTTVDTVVKNSQEVKVKATYSGNRIEIPAAHFAIKDDGILRAKDNYAGSNKIEYVNAEKLKYKDLYNVSSARLDRKDATDTIIVDVFDTEKEPATVVKKSVLISDALPDFTTFKAADAITLNPYNTTIHLNQLQGRKSELAYVADGHELKITDQYNKNIFSINAWEYSFGSDYYDAGKYYSDPIVFEYLVKDVAENKDGFVNGNFKIEENATENATIIGAEPGDTFTLEITAMWNKADYPALGDLPDLADTSVTHVVKVTVGADSNCMIHDSDNNYSDDRGDKDANGNISNPKTVREYLQYQLNELLGTEGTSK